LSDWLKLTRNGAVIAATASVLFFLNSPHDAEAIAVAIATPLVIFNCTPVLARLLLEWLATRLSKGPQFSQPVPAIESFPRHIRIVAYAVLGTALVMMLCFLAGISILLGTFVYPTLGASWAVEPARWLSFTLLLCSGLPILGSVCFLAGIHYSSDLLSSAAFSLISSRALRDPLKYWPTAA